jgi:hypothetical protein
MALGSTQPLTEMSTTNLPGVKGLPVRKADNLTAICEYVCIESVGASTSHNPTDLHGLLQGQLSLLYFISFTVLCEHVKRQEEISQMALQNIINVHFLVVPPCINIKVPEEN